MNDVDERERVSVVICNINRQVCIYIVAHVSNNTIILFDLINSLISSEDLMSSNRDDTRPIGRPMSDESYPRSDIRAESSKSKKLRSILSIYSSSMMGGLLFFIGV